MHETTFKSGSHIVWGVVLLKAFLKQTRLHLGQPPAFTWLGRWPTIDNLHVFFALFLHVVGDLHIYLLSTASHGREVVHIQVGELPLVLNIGPLITICAFTTNYNNQSCIQRKYDVDVLI
jgi:hypothetical protein